MFERFTCRYMSGRPVRNYAKKGLACNVTNKDGPSKHIGIMGNREDNTTCKNLKDQDCASRWDNGMATQIKVTSWDEPRQKDTRLDLRTPQKLPSWRHLPPANNSIHNPSTVSSTTAYTKLAQKGTIPSWTLKKGTKITISEIASTNKNHDGDCRLATREWRWERKAVWNAKARTREECLSTRLTQLLGLHRIAL